MKKRFSIIITAYNIEEYIQRSINSVKEQSFQNYEIIVVDDCSKDNTKQKIEEIGGVNLIIHEENKGAGGARNSALDIAQGEYIIFLDGDDYLHDANVLEKLDKIIENQTPDVVYMGFQFGGDRDELIIPTPENCTKSIKAAKDPYPNVWSKCWNREFIEKYHFRFCEKRYYEDVLFLYRGIMKVENFLIAPFPVHTYISGRKNSITTTLHFKNIYDTIANLEEMAEMKKTEPSEELDYIMKREINMCKKRLEKIVKL